MYIRQSVRNLEVIVKEHVRAVENGNTDASAITEHAWKSDHRISWEAVEVVDVSTELYRICTCMTESWHIRPKKETVDRDQGILSQIYNILN